MHNAPDKKFLMAKVPPSSDKVLRFRNFFSFYLFVRCTHIFDGAGTCRYGELVGLKLDDIKDVKTALLVRILDRQF